jgi:hypothetical protein
MVSILTSQLHLFQEIIDAGTEHLLQPQQKNPSTFAASIRIKEELLKIQVTNTKMILDFGYMHLSMTLMNDFEFDFSRRGCRNQ